MLLARVEGSIVATRKHPVSRLADDYLPAHRRHRASEGAPQVALDPHGAGMHQQVIISSDGSAARTAVKDPKSPARWIIIGIVDEKSRGCPYETRSGHGPRDVEQTVPALEGARWLIVRPFTREH